MSEETRQIKLEAGILSGVSTGTIKKIIKTGITTVEALATLNPKDLKEDANMGLDTAENAIKSAIDLTENGFITGNELWEKRKLRTRLSTGSRAIDEIMRNQQEIEGGKRGGFESETTTELAAANGVGKTQLCHQLAVMAQLPVSDGGLDGEVVWIDTEDTFIPGRIKQICDAKGYNVTEVLDKIHFGLALNVPHQGKLIEQLYGFCPEHNIKLIIVDSLMGLLRGEYIGRATLSARQDKLKTMLLTLGKVARSTKTTVIYTNQILDDPGSMYTNASKATGGNVMGHAATTRIWLRKGRKGSRVFKINKSPYLDELEATFLITENGIEDTEDNTKKWKKQEEEEE
ncbi:MAG: DNA repair and recombination protein RadA [Proteobacteria bacterium]|nr:DNA repair and recombination protein RadA [Pseudomonadota bacterium]